MTHERTILNLKAYSFAVSIFALGVVALFASAHEHRWLSEEWRVVTREVGALLVVTGVLSVFWELFSKRSVIDEVLSRVGIVRNIHDSGLLEITGDFHREIDWEALFKNARELDIFFACGRTWLGAHGSKVLEVVARGGQIRVVMPDPDDARIVEELARRFSTQPDELVNRIRHTLSTFEDLGKQGNATIAVWFLPRPPVFSYYRFDDRALLATYHHRNTRWHVPAFTFERDGSLFRYFAEEFDAMISGKNPAARLVYKNYP